MSALAQNKFLAGLGAVTLVGAGVLGYLAYSAADAHSTAEEEYQTAASNLTQLQSGKPFPSEENAKAFTSLKTELQAKINALQAQLSTAQIPLEEIPPNAFQDKLKEAVASIISKKTDKKVEVPDKFYLGFDKYQSETPKLTAAAALYRELRALQLVFDLILETQNVQVKEITRHELKEEKDIKPELKPDPKSAKGKKGDDESKHKLVEHETVNLKLSTTQAGAISIINGLVNHSQQFFIIRNISVLNEKQDPSPKGVPGTGAVPAPAIPATPATPGAVAPADPTAAANTSITRENIFGRERLDLNIELEIVNVAKPEAPAEKGAGKPATKK